jgi:hypothetical protein
VKTFSLSRALRPPAGAEKIPDVGQTARARAVMIATALLTDLIIVTTLRNPAMFRVHVLDAFAAINMSLLTLDLLITLFLLRNPSSYRLVLQEVCIAFEAFTIVVWIQVTGLVSSYFLLIAPVIILGYRFFLGYRVGLVIAASFVVCHVGAYILENLGVLRIAGLFVNDPGAIYSAPAYRLAAMISILWVYFGAFMFSNWMFSALAAKEEQLRDARDDLERANAEKKPGRLTGATLDGYRLGEVLGRGGMGEVYEAANEGGDRVAIKVLYGHLAGHPTVLERFQREADAARKLPSDFVAAVHKVGTTSDGAPYLIMDFLRGEDLAAMLRRRERLPPAELFPIIEALAAALDAAHEQGIVHRDVKPQNVFLVEGGGVRLLDFGVAHLDEGIGLTQTSALLGTPGYLAPEQITGASRDIGPHTDVFALGAIVYRALTGQAAFAAKNASAAAFEAVHHSPAPPSRLAPDVNADMDAVVALALAKKPAERYSRASTFARDLRAAFEGTLPPSVRLRATSVAPPSGTPVGDATLAS